MPGKYSHLKSELEKVGEEPERQKKLDALKETYQDKTVGEISEEFRRCYDEKEKLEEQKSETQLLLDALTQLLISQMEGSGLNQVRTEDGGTTLFIKDDVYCQQQNRQEFLQWVRDTGQEELLTVHYSTMNGIAKERLTSGKPLPPGLKAFFKQSVSIRRNNK